MLPLIPLYDLLRQPRLGDLSAAAATQELVPDHGSRGFGFHAETQRGTSDLWALWRFTRSYGLLWRLGASQSEERHLPAYEGRGSKLAALRGTATSPHAPPLPPLAADRGWDAERRRVRWSLVCYSCAFPWERSPNYHSWLPQESGAR